MKLGKGDLGSRFLGSSKRNFFPLYGHSGANERSTMIQGTEIHVQTADGWGC
jgi:hypothetical protein